MRAITDRLRSGYILWTHRACQGFRLRYTPAWAGLVIAACSGGGTPPLPVTQITGPASGPTVALVAGVHGGKVAAVRALEQLARELPGELQRGRILLVAPANVAGYTAGLAQLSPLDSLNLNRVFPGDPAGRPTERLAARLLREIVSESDYLIDLHGSDGDEAVGRFAYAARPGVNPEVDSVAQALARHWGSPVIVWDDAGPRTLAESRFLQTAAHLSGVPAITVFEAGRTREDSAATAAFVRGARRALAAFGLLPSDPRDSLGAAPPELFDRRGVVLADSAGTWTPLVAPGQRLRAGERIGRLAGSPEAWRDVSSPDGGLVLHVRQAGRVGAATPLVISALRADSTAP